MHSVHIPFCAIGVFGAFVFAEHTSNAFVNRSVLQWEKCSSCCCFFNIPVMCAWDEFDLTEVLVLYLLTYKIITEQTCQSVRRLAKCPFHIGYWKNSCPLRIPQGYPCQRTRLNEPLLLALVDGLCEGGVVDDDGGVGAVGRLRPLGLVCVVGALVTEHVTHQKHQRAEDGENHHCDDAYVRQNDIKTMIVMINCCQNQFRNIVQQW